MAQSRFYKLKAMLMATIALTIATASYAKDYTKSVGYEYLNSSFTHYDTLQKLIHGYAEVAFEEKQSSRLIADELEAAGFTVERGVAGMPTAFIATYGSGEPVIGLFGEYDALPGMSQDTSAFRNPIVPGGAGHACGHNLIGTAPLAAAIAISKWLAEGHNGTIKYFGCPAEEKVGGKTIMIQNGCFDGCKVILDWHPFAVNKVTVSRGLAIICASFTFKGTSAHAGLSPWNGRSALDAVESFNYMVNMMREHVRPEVRIHYVIRDGGKAPNIVPDYAKVDYYFRAPTGKEALEVFRRALKAAQGAALGTETEMSYTFEPGIYESLSNEVISKVYQKALAKVGGIRLDEREREFVSEIMRNSGMEPDLTNYEYVYDDLGERESLEAVSSDVGNVSQTLPVARLIYSAYCPAGGGHCWQNVSIGGTTIGTKALINVAKIQYLTVLELFNHPEIIEAAWKEYYDVQGKDYQYIPLEP